MELVGYEYLNKNNNKGGKKKEELLGKMVRITKGEYKGQRGLVKGATDTDLRVLLLSKS